MTADLEILGIACSVFRPEIELLDRRGEIGFPVSFVDSHLHMQPDLLAETLRSRLGDLLKPGRGVILFFGDCCVQMHHLCADRRITRLDGLNCGMLLLGRQRYLELMHQRAFLVFPEWAARWRDIQLELNASCSQAGLCLLHDAQIKLIYLDTGAGPVPESELSAYSAYLDLPWEVIYVSLDHFSELICKAKAKLCCQDDTARSVKLP